MKQLLVLGPKGGVGKTTVVRNLAVAGVLSGLRVIMVDTDRQRTLTRWCERRPESLPLIQHIFYPFKDITEGFEDDDSYDLMIVDTPASVEDNPRGLRAMVDAADFVLLPTGASGEDMDSLKETLDALRATSTHQGIVLNAAKPRLTETIVAHRALSAAVDVGPVIPDLAEVPRTYDAGIGVLELRGAKTADAVWTLWAFVSERLGIGA
jgi:chromosome partitioning protein